MQELAAAFRDPAMHQHLKVVYRFKDKEQVELLARVMRVWDEDGVPDPSAIDFGEFIIKVSCAYAHGCAGIQLLPVVRPVLQWSVSQAQPTRLTACAKTWDECAGVLCIHLMPALETKHSSASYA